ncbi:hypothetical protein [[Mycobacterium] nativiensis]|uniref:hypothetical protein n=1 Tax=[Mycobacterium] nativiensis TaxID=2855503 RepID=UPI002E7905AA|nr:hypothetical protein [Mycolicibacter sp. MYC340]
MGAHAAGAPDHSAEAPSRHGRHSGPVAPEGGRRRRADSRHSADAAGNQAQPAPVEPPPPAPAPTPEPAPESTPAASRHSSGAETSADGEPSTGGQSVADLLARLQPVPTEGRRRRRRED